MALEDWVMVLAPIIVVGAIATWFFTRMNSDPRGEGFNQKYDPKTGIGKGAPGFQTSVKRIAVTPEIAARMRAGEQVSQEEIAEAVARAQSSASSSTTHTASKPQVEDEWLPETVTKKSTNRRTRKR